MASTRHHTYNRRHDLPATNCEGKLRRIYVRAGVGRYYVAIGTVCDTCAAIALDDDRFVRMAEVAAMPRNRAETRKQVARTRARRKARSAASQALPPPTTDTPRRSGRGRGRPARASGPSVGSE